MVAAQRVIDHSNLILEYWKAEFVRFPPAKGQYLSLLLVQIEIAVGIAHGFSSLDKGSNVPLQGRSLFWIGFQRGERGISGRIELNHLFSVSYSSFLCNDS